MHNITSRISRLEALIRRFQRESALIRQANAPPLYVERQAYLSALEVAARGLESARIVLAKARQRLQPH
jgi:hypothetical protein